MVFFMHTTDCFDAQPQTSSPSMTAQFTMAGCGAAIFQPLNELFSIAGQQARIFFPTRQIALVNRMKVTNHKEIVNHD